jgi:hypothetical protein
MKNQLDGGLQIVAECKSTSINMTEMVNKLDENVHSVGLKLNEEAMKRDTVMQDVQFKMDRLNTAQQHETARLAEAFDSCLNLLQQADGQLGNDLRSLEQKLEATRDLASANQDEALRQVAEARAMADRSIGDASSALLKQAHDDAERQVNQLADTVAKFETRIVKGESLSSDTANRWLASNEQLKKQYNSVSQAVEQCRLQNRTTQASTQEVRDKLQVQAEAEKAQVSAMKTEQQRERKARDEQLKAMQQNLDGTMKSTLTELEQKLSNRVDREADERIVSIRQALDDIGTVLEKEIPSKLRQEERNMQLKKYSGSITLQTPTRTGVTYVDSNGNTIMTPANSMPMRTATSYQQIGIPQQRSIVVSGGTGGSNGVPAFPTTIAG